MPTPLMSFTVDGDRQAPPLVLGPSIGTSGRVWSPQIPGLVQDFRVIRFDLPGHFGEPAEKGPYTVAGLAEGLLRGLDGLGVDTFDYCGLSMGGALGQQLAIDHPDRVNRLVLVCTSATFGDSPRPWLDRADRVRAEGTGFLPDLARGRWFAPDVPVPPLGRELLQAQTALDPEGYAACCEALAAFDSRAELGRVRCPTRVVAGADDLATPVASAQELAAGIPGADLVVVPQAAHLAPVDQPAAVLQAIRRHLFR
ncbi:alpha/beta fold hydrolase [Kineosporia sp. J2-2]|uniref:Alpha/beta fold hydrolase n=1 Tax=Kineosporia corallincola TaxID=2835133 RepID=A0ABS5TQL8_9ACTN|nr:alpha/beta fold hydrolase [Kineosporia corallincola]MBT0772754.1 alpha/beta fold hydrolase [Kineosporia corallincola]